MPAFFSMNFHDVFKLKKPGQSNPQLLNTLSVVPSPKFPLESAKSKKVLQLMAHSLLRTAKNLFLLLALIWSKVVGPSLSNTVWCSSNVDHKLTVLQKNFRFYQAHYNVACGVHAHSSIWLIAFTFHHTTRLDPSLFLILFKRLIKVLVECTKCHSLLYPRILIAFLENQKPPSQDDIVLCEV